MIRPIRQIASLTLSFGLLAGCSDEDNDSSLPADGIIAIDFAEDPAWGYGQSDYSTSTAPVDVRFETLDLPAPFSGRGLYAAGTNESDDLFLYIKHRVHGFEPNQRYALSYSVTFLTSAPADCIGVGGAPGESVYFKAGASVVEPLTIEEDGEFRMNVDKGNQAATGVDALTIGDVAGTNTDCDNTAFEEKTLSSENPLDVTTDSEGALWLLLGTDSGYEARTEIYYRRAEITTTPN